jgi:hypothetical protein
MKFRHFLCYAVLIGAIVFGLSLRAQFLPVGVGKQPAGGGQSIASVAPSSASFSSTAAAATTIAAVAVTMSPAAPAFTGTTTLSNAVSGDSCFSGAVSVLASNFQIVSGNLQTAVANLAPGTYCVHLIATQAGATGSPFTQVVVLTSTAAAGPFVLVPNAHTAVHGTGTAACGPSTAISTVGAKLIVVYVANYATSTGTNILSDSVNGGAGNPTWTQDISYDPSGGGYKILVYHVYSPTVGASHTFTFTGNYCALFVAAFSGGSATPGLDQTNTTPILAPGATTWPNATATPGSANQLVVAVTQFASNAGTINSITAPFIITDTVPYVSSSTSYGGSFAYQIQTTAALANPTWTANANQTPITAIATYK